MRQILLGSIGQPEQATRRRRRALVAVVGAAAVLTALLPTGPVGAADEPTDVGEAPTAPAPVGAAGAAEVAAPEGARFAPDTLAGSLDLYQRKYLNEADSEIGWTGSLGGCSAGTTSATFKAGVLRRINYYRAMAGVSDTITFTGDKNSRAQQAALMMAANNTLNHDPPTSFRCYTATGDQAAADTNLHLGRFGANAIDGYMMDPGTFNTPAGHRRWILHPPITTMGTGDVSASPRANALFVLDDSQIFDPIPAPRDVFVAWPPPGFVPKPVVFDRWSFSRNGANFANARVSMTRDGAPLSVTRYAPVNGYGLNTLVWDPSAGNFRPGVYRVSITGVVVNGVTKSFNYKVTVFNPDQAINVATPAEGGDIARGATVLADYACVIPNLASCEGTVPVGSPIDTTTLGAASFTVTATDTSGAEQSRTSNFEVVDRTKPTVTVTSPPADAVYLQGETVLADYSCADEEGGTGLASCTASVADGAALDTTAAGFHPFTVTGTDNAGNQRSVERPYRVAMRPDALIGTADAGPFVGDDIYEVANTPAQTQSSAVARGATATFFVPIGNDAGASATFSVRGVTTDGEGYRVSYRDGNTDITDEVLAGTYVLPSLAPGDTATIKVKVTSLSTATVGSTAKVDVVVRSEAGPWTRDTVRAKVTTT